MSGFNINFAIQIWEQNLVSMRGDPTPQPSQCQVPLEQMLATDFFELGLLFLASEVTSKPKPNFEHVNRLEHSSAESLSANGMENNVAQVKGQPQHLEGVVPASAGCLVPSVVYFNEDYVSFCEISFSSFVNRTAVAGPGEGTPNGRHQPIIWPISPKNA